MTLAEEDPSSSNLVQHSEQHFQALKQAVLQKRPVLKNLVEQKGNQTLLEYAREFSSTLTNPPLQQRRDEFIVTFQEEVERQLGTDIAIQAAEQLRQYYFVSTADHHGPIVNESWCNSNLLIGAPYSEHHDALRYVIVLACANISLNNITFPRGLIFHAVTAQQELKLQRLSFLPSNAHAAMVYNFRAYSIEDIKKMERLLGEKVKRREVSEQVAEKIQTLLQNVYAQPDVLACQNFSDQVTKTNYILWQHYFSESGQAPSNLLYIEQERIVSRLIIKHHLFTDTVITHMLFDEDYEPLLQEHFANIQGAFSSTREWGTYLFWGISEPKHHRVALWLKGRQLISDDGTFVVDLTPAAIQEALESGRIIPSLLVVFSVLCFYYGLKCLGGFNQTNYLTNMKNAYLRLHADRGNYKSVEMCAHAQTKEMCDGFITAFCGGPQNELVPAAGLDLYLYNTPNTWLTIMEEVKNLTLNDALNPSLPEFYRYVYSESERVSELAAITADDVTKLTGLDKKIKPCVVAQ